jgi:hypothetical protein
MSLDIEDYTYQDMLKLYKIQDTSQDPIYAMTERLQKIKDQFPNPVYLFYKKVFNLLQFIFYCRQEGKLVKGYDRFLSQLVERDVLELYPSPALLEEFFPSAAPPPPVVYPLIQSFVNPLSPSDLNVVKRMTQVMNLDLNSCFRSNYYASTASDFMYTLPSPIKNVVSMRLASIELPNAWYLISTNNRCSIQHQGILYEICIPAGNYDIDTLQDAFHSYLPATIRFSIHPITFRTEFRVEGTASFYFSFGNNLQSTLGWLLGFRLGGYEEIGLLVSEGLFDAGGDRYIYMSLKDFQSNTHTLHMVGYERSSMDEDIIAKVPLINGKLSLIVNTNDNPVVKIRKYNGPIHLTKIQVRLYDKFGEIIDLNHMDYSFTLEVEILYDATLFNVSK